MLNAGVRSPFLGGSAQEVHSNPKGGMAMKRRGIIALSRLRRAFGAKLPVQRQLSPAL
jgi:hypothetical protein